jgi:hypothetical protein
MSNTRSLRLEVTKKLENAKSKYGPQAQLHLFKFMTPESWAFSQVLNCLVEHGMKDGSYAVKEGPRPDKVIDAMCIYPEEWMTIASCPARPRYALEYLEKTGVIAVGSRKFGRRKTGTIQINWKLLLEWIEKAEACMEKYHGKEAA